MRYCAGLIFFISSLVAGLISWLHRGSLPDRVPIHFDLSGKVDGYASSNHALWFMPIFLLGFSAVFGLVGIVGGVRLPMNATRGLNVVAFAVSVFMVVLHNMLLEQNTGAVPMMIPMFLSVLLIVIGYAMKGIEPNPFIGIRVPWTMNSPMVWRKTHERASKLWMIGGLVAFCFAIVGAPIVVPILLFVGCILYPLLDSYRISKAR